MALVEEGKDSFDWYDIDKVFYDIGQSSLSKDDKAKIKKALQDRHQLRHQLTRRDVIEIVGDMHRAGEIELYDKDEVFSRFGINYDERKQLGYN